LICTTCYYIARRTSDQHELASVVNEYDELKSETSQEEEAYENQNHYLNYRYQAVSFELPMSEVKRPFFQVGQTTASLVVSSADEHQTFLPPHVLELEEPHDNVSSEVAT